MKIEAVLEAQENKVYTIKDIQDYLGIGKNTAYKLLKLPNFPVIKIGKKYIIPKDSFEEWISKSLNKEFFQ